MAQQFTLLFHSRKGGACEPQPAGCSISVLSFLLQSKDLQVRWTANTKLPAGVNVVVCLCVSPVIDWRPVQGVPLLFPSACWEDSSPPAL